MKRRIALMTLGVLAAWGAWVGWGLTAAASPTAEGGGGSATISDFMVVVHDPQGLLAQLQKSMAGGGPADDKAWKGVKARAVIIPALAEDILTRQSPQKGAKSSWKQHVDGYLRIARRLAEAAAAEKAATVKAELLEIKKTCDNCHKAHR
jgi:hypothetical protein